jgi:prepilin-type N-terminal cleavage/methylation domain-containing protein
MLRPYLPSTFRNPKSAFTLVELLTAITIIGILVSLLLPAVQAAREAARNMQCRNNLKQIGVAMHARAEETGTFPPGYYWLSGSSNDSYGNEATWVTFLLPYLDQRNMYDTIDWTSTAGSFGGAWGSPYKYRPITSALLTVMQCPSSSRVTDLWWYNTYAKGNYAANNGYGPEVEWNVPSTDRMAGAFFLEPKRTGRTPAYFVDGLSNTAFVSEVLALANQGGTQDVRGVMHYPEGPLYHHNRTPNDSYPDQIRPGYCISTAEAPCEDASGWRAVLMTARSVHPGGVNLLLGDGSTRFVSNSISLANWQALATPRTNDVLTGDF